MIPWIASITLAVGRFVCTTATWYFDYFPWSVFFFLRVSHIQTSAPVLPIFTKIVSAFAIFYFMSVIFVKGIMKFNISWTWINFYRLRPFEEFFSLNLKYNLVYWLIKDSVNPFKSMWTRILVTFWIIFPIFLSWSFFTPIIPSVFFEVGSIDIPIIIFHFWKFINYS